MTTIGKTARWEFVVWPVLTTGVVLLFWYLAVLWSGTKIFPSPVEVQKGIVELLEKHVLWADIADSLRRVAIGFGLATALALPTGLLLGLYPAFHETLNPLLQLLRPISPLAWIPVAILLLGIGDHAAIFLIFLGSFFPMAVSCADAAARVPRVYIEAGQNLGLRNLGLLRRVILPAVLPRVLTGLRVALGIAWLVVVAAEMVAVDSGLGFLVIDSRNSGKRYDLVVAAMLMIGVIGLILDTMLRTLERHRALRWGFRHDF